MYTSVNNGGDILHKFQEGIKFEYKSSLKFIAASLYHLVQDSISDTTEDVRHSWVHSPLRDRERANKTVTHKTS